MSDPTARPVEPFLSYHYEYDEEGNQSAPIIDRDEHGLAPLLSDPARPVEPPEGEPRSDAVLRMATKLCNDLMGYALDWPDELWEQIVALKDRCEHV